MYRKDIFIGAVVVLISVLNLSCQDKQREQLTGDLYFPWLKMANFYGMPDSVYAYYAVRRDDLGFDSLEKEDPKGTAFMKMLEHHHLLFEPYVYVQLEHDKNVLLFMDSATYKPFTEIDYQELRNEKMKIRIRASVKKTAPLVYIVEEIRRVDKVPGETFLVEKKYKIENYK